MRSPFENSKETGADESWIYPDHDSLLDFASHDCQDPTNDDDLLELRTDPFVFASLTPDEFHIINRRYGFDGEGESMKQIAHDLGVTHAEAKEILSNALSKVRDNMRTSA